VSLELTDSTGALLLAAASVIGLGANVTESDRYQVVKLLIEHGADPNRRTIPGVQTLAGTIQLVVSSAAQWIWPVCKA